MISAGPFEVDLLRYGSRIHRSKERGTFMCTGKGISPRRGGKISLSICSPGSSWRST